MTSFLIFGCVPLLSYLFFVDIDFGGYDPKFVISICLTLVTLGVLGFVKVLYILCIYYFSNLFFFLCILWYC